MIVIGSIDNIGIEEILAVALGPFQMQQKQLILASQTKYFRPPSDISAAVTEARKNRRIDSRCDPAYVGLCFVHNIKNGDGDLNIQTNKLLRVLDMLDLNIWVRL